MSDYSTRQVSAIVGWPDRRVRYWARTGLVASRPATGGQYRYSFQDIVTLRTVRSLMAGRVTSRRVTRVMRALARQLPPGRAPSSVPLAAEGERIVARDAASAWDPENGQRLLAFEADEVAEAGIVAPLTATPAPAASSAAAWFERGLEAEAAGRDAEAQDAYRSACEADPRHAPARINLGRLRHGAGALREAHQLYREALALVPHDATAWFNLGVVLEDGGDLRNALASYLKALEHEPALPDAHYNAARLYQQRGELVTAGHHYSQFKHLTRAPEA